METYSQNSLEDYVDLFNEISNDEPDGSHVYFMMPNEVNTKNPLEGAEYQEPVEEKAFKPFQAKPNASTIVSGTDDIKVSPDAANQEEVDIKDLPAEDQELLKEMDENDGSEFIKDAEQAMNSVQSNTKSISHSEKQVSTSIQNSNGYGKSMEYKEVDGEPKFLKVRNTKPVEKLETCSTEKSNTGSTFSKIPTSGNFDDKADAALDKFSNIVSKMKHMNMYESGYQKKCARILQKYSNLPKAQFESLCQFMDKVH